jgi:surface antigen
VPGTTTSLTSKLTRQTLTRITGGIAVGAALVATIAATATITDTTPRTGTSLAAAAAEGNTNLLAPAPMAKPAIKPQAKPAAEPAAEPALPHHQPVTADDVITLAKKQVGIAETDGRGGGTKFQNWYADSHFAQQTAQRDGAATTDYKDAAWCAMFITWLGNQFHFNDQMGADAYTVAHADWFQNHHRFGHTPKPGAVVFFDWNGGKTTAGIDHVGLVVKDNHNGTIETIEGNADNQVEHKQRSTDLVAGYGYPNYAKK